MGAETTAATDLGISLARALHGEVRFDAYTRHLFSTDASMYAIEPLGVAFPRDADDVVAAMHVAAEFDVPVLPRGAGTSHCGQTVGAAVVLDFSRHMNGICEVDPEARQAHVQPGVVQEHLNQAVAPHGLWFAPDTSTANRATLGGMIGNNSCGSRSARYGMTVDHVAALDVVLSDGSATTFEHVDAETAAVRGKADTLAGTLYREIPRLLAEHEELIRARLPGFWRQAGGYRLERGLRDGGVDLARLMVGSEGTLAAVTGARVDLVARPRATVTAVGHFETTQGAIDASADAMACDAAAVEMVDRYMLDLSRSSPKHRHLAAMFEGDPGALLFVEFYGDSTAEAEAGLDRLEREWAAHGHGYAVLRATDAKRQAQVRAFRRAGLGLLMASGQPDERSLAFVEDTAVAPENLADYTRAFASVLDAHGLRAGFYGHASAGCLHVRPFMRLHEPGQVDTLRAVADEIKSLVVEFGGANSSEHGDGLARSQYNRELFGDELYEAMRQVKGLFDPHGRMNPGKKVDAPPMTAHLREPQLPRAPELSTFYAFEEPGGLFGAANSCMRIGACRKSAASGGTMCPSYMATLDEEHSTRGRANAFVKALSSPEPQQALGDERLHEILDLCLECKACKTECPLSVDMAKMKSEALAQRHEQDGASLRTRVFGGIRTFNRLGSAGAPLSNSAVRTRWVRAAMERAVGIDRRRPLPEFARETVPRWFARRPSPAGPFPRGEVVFLADSFTSFTEPSIGKAAIEVLERAGWQVHLEAGGCCGRPMISKGMLTEAREAAGSLLGRLAEAVGSGIPVVGCEPSCLLSLRDEYHDLLPADERVPVVSGGAWLFEELVAQAIDDGGLALREPREPLHILLHGHCHQKAGPGTAATLAILGAIPGASVTEVDAGCCGMAGSFGFEAEHYDISMRIGAQRLFPAVEGTPAATHVVATGVSCRQQIDHGTSRTARHPAELLRDFL